MSYYLYVPISTDNQLLVFAMNADAGQLEPFGAPCELGGSAC